jgi:hypothetical protein
MLVAVVLLALGRRCLCEQRVDVDNLDLELVSAFAVLRPTKAKAASATRNKCSERKAPFKQVTHLC